MLQARQSSQVWSPPARGYLQSIRAPARGYPGRTRAPARACPLGAAVMISGVIVVRCSSGSVGVEKSICLCLVFHVKNTVAGVGGRGVCCLMMSSA